MSKQNDKGITLRSLWYRQRKGILPNQRGVTIPDKVKVHNGSGNVVIEGTFKGSRGDYVASIELLKAEGIGSGIVNYGKYGLLDLRAIFSCTCPDEQFTFRQAKVVAGLAEPFDTEFSTKGTGKKRHIDECGYCKHLGGLVEHTFKKVLKPVK